MSVGYPPFLRVMVLLGSVMLAQNLFAAPLWNHPITIIQPDGLTVHCFVSGDEYYNWMHDPDGYTIIQDPNTGYYTYAVQMSGLPVPSRYVVGRTNPAAIGLERNVRPVPERFREVKAPFPFGSSASLEYVINAPTTGIINNIVISIRFSDETEFGRQIGPYDSMFNATSGNSLRNYFQEVSYGKLSVNTSFYPLPSGSSIVSYQDSYPRRYYQPYSASNTDGYANDSERTVREHTLLFNAVNSVSSQIPGSLKVDADGDSCVDNVCFIVKGSPTGWASLLWPHMWSLYTKSAYINGKRVATYNFQLESALDSSGVGVLCHEMFHSLGSPDLYHYNHDGFRPVGAWDLMESNLNPPQHMSAYMKYRYGKWISSIPTLSAPGIYTLDPLTSSGNNAFIINSNRATEYYIVEFRKKSGAFESSLPGEGLLVYRINAARDGNGNSAGPPDEVYVYRPNGTLTSDGSVNSAPLSADLGRTAIDDSTNPSSFLSDGSAGGLQISNIGSVGGSISFQFGMIEQPAAQAQITSLQSVSGASIGGVVKLSAQVKNVGSVALPANAAVWFYVAPAGSASRPSVGSIAIAGLAAGTAKQCSVDWAIPTSYTAGNYTYWARALAGSDPISDWSSGQNFTIISGGTETAQAQIMSLQPITAAVVGSAARPGAKVKNTGSTILPSNAEVWFYVAPVGSASRLGAAHTSVARLAAGATEVYIVDWIIPTSLVAGEYTYWARVLTGSDPISDWSGGQNFTIAATAALAQVTSLQWISGATVGSTAKLGGQVKNVGPIVLPSTAVVCFYVAPAGSSSRNPVGSVTVAGLAIGVAQGYAIDWTIPNSYAVGNHTYWARVFVDSNPISEWSSGQNFAIGAATIRAQVTGLQSIADTALGGTAKLAAQVKNTGSVVLPSDTLVWFYVAPTASTLRPSVGSISAVGLGIGASQGYALDWTVPAAYTPGDYTYWARVLKGSDPISDWSSGQNFTISSPAGYPAQVVNLSPVIAAKVGSACTLRARVQNIGSSALPSGAGVWFSVIGPQIDYQWVGSAPVSGLTPGSQQTCSLNWIIPSNASVGTYTYRARIFADSNAISDWSTSKRFTVTADSTPHYVQVTGLYPLKDPTAGATTTLAAQVNNTGSSVLPSDAAVWFYVGGSGMSEPWVGSAPVSGLSGTDWFTFDWTIPKTTSAGIYTYWARVYRGSTAISDWSAGQQFTIASGATASASILKLSSVTPASTSGVATLWAQIKNTGRLSLPTNTVAWFWISGYGYVGSVSASALEADSSSWYSLIWNVPSRAIPGDYWYFVRVFVGSTAISGWSDAQAFTVASGASISADIVSLYPVSGSSVGGTCKLWAKIRNTGGIALPSDASVWFYVSGPGFSNPWIGSTSVSELPVDEMQWYSFDWAVPNGAFPSDSYRYWARMYSGATAIGAWSEAQQFTVAEGSGDGFNEQFNDSISRWGSNDELWSVEHGFYSAIGVGDAFVTSNYETEFTDLDYTALLWRSGTDDSANSLVIRATGIPSGYDNLPASCYVFQYTRDGHFSIFRIADDRYVVLQNWVATDSINKGDNWNKLRVVALGSSFWFYVNDNLVWQGSDSTLPRGNVGVGFYSNPESSNERFYADYAVLSTNPSRSPERLNPGQKFLYEIINGQPGSPENSGSCKQGVGVRKSAP